MAAPLNGVSTTNKNTVKSDYGIQGLIIYEFLLPDGHVYIGQTSKGETRFKQHFGNTYYYLLGQPPANTEDQPENLYKYLRTVPWNKTIINYEYAPFGISFETLDNFRKRFRFKTDINIPTKDLAEGCVLNYAEVLHIYRAVQTYGAGQVLNKQMGSKSDQGLYTINIDNNGNIQPGTLILSQSSSISAAANVFNDKGNLLEQLQNFVNKYVNKHIKEIYNQSLFETDKGLQISFEELKKQINKTIKEKLPLEQIKTQLGLDFTPELKINPAKDFSIRTSIKAQFIESYKKSLKELNNKTFKSLDSLYKQLERKVSFSLLTIEDIFTSETIAKIQAKSGNQPLKINKMTHTVPRELFKYEAYLRFNNIFVHERDQIQPQGNVVPFHTRKNDNRQRHADEESKLPYIEFTPNRSAGALKQRIFEIFKSGGFYYGHSGDDYYGHFMALVAGKHDVAYLRTLPLTHRSTKERGDEDNPITRQQGAVYIHTDLPWESPPTTQPLEADKVGAAYITKAGEDNGITSMLSATLTNITDY